MSSERRIGTTRWGLPFLVAGVAVVAGVIGGVIAYAIDQPSPAHASSSVGATQTSASCAVTTVANKVLPSVVTISVTGPVGANGQPSGGGTGSGEVIRADGYILTNNHVVAPAASGGSITVLFDNGKSVPATLVGRDALTDLAVVKVNESSLPTVTLGSSASLKVGEPVVALGAPLGLSSTVTSGIVSALDRNVQVPGESDSQSALLAGAIQTDAAINPGNSGGVLTNCAGQMVGIPSAGATVPNSEGGSSAGNIGLGFAIPINLAKTVSDELITSGHATHSFFGLVAQPVRAQGDVNGPVKGLLVTEAIPGGPAASAGLRTGDLITQVAGTPATDTVQLMAIALTKRPGNKVDITYERDGHSSTATLTLGHQPTTAVPKGAA